jgi:hypothetical protein
VCGEPSLSTRPLQPAEEQIFAPAGAEIVIVVADDDSERVGSLQADILAAHLLCIRQNFRSDTRPVRITLRSNNIDPTFRPKE